MTARGLTLLLAAILAGLGALGVACGGGGEEEKGGEEPQATQAAPAAGETEVAVGINDYFFEPDALQAEAGAPVKVELENEGNVSHTFTIDELGVDQALGPGEKATVELSADQGGTFAFYCRFHRGRGMEGELTVSGAGGSAAPSGGAKTPVAGAGYSSGY